jgi:hypothetical protein
MVQICRSEGLLGEYRKIPQSVVCYVQVVEQRIELTYETLRVRCVSINKVLHSYRIILHFRLQVFLALLMGQPERSFTSGTEEEIASKVREAEKVCLKSDW